MKNIFVGNLDFSIGEDDLRPQTTVDAFVVIPATSEPAPGSVIPRQPIFSPLSPGTR